MADIIKVGIDEPRPTHDIKLTDVITGDEVGLILTNRLGVRDPRGIMEGNMPRTALRTSQGNTGYDDMELPFTAELQSTMVGGRAQEDFSKDRTKYADAFRMDTTKEFPICGPLEELQTGLSVTTLDYRPVIMSPPLLFTRDCIGTTNYYFKIPMAAGTVVTGVEIRLSLGYDATTIFYGPVVHNDPEDGVITLNYSKFIPTKGSGPGYYYLPFDALVTSSGFLEFSLDTDKTVFVYCNMNFTSPAGADILQWDSNSFETIVDRQGTPSTNRTLDALWYTVADTEHKTKLFEYKRQMYLVQNMSDGTSASKLFVNGYRGQAVSNSADKNYLYLGLPKPTANIAADALKGKIVLIIDGPGENEQQPWRRIIDNDAFTVGDTSFRCKVSPAWKVTHTTNTSYVILDTNVWTLITGHGLDKPVTDVAVVNGMVVFAMGNEHELVYMSETNVNGTWTRTFKADTTSPTPLKADRLEPIVNELGQLYVWRAIADGARVDCSRAGVYSDTNPLIFDINKDERAAAQLIITRAEADKATEEAKNTLVVTELTALKRTYDDLTIEHNRILVDYDIITSSTQTLTEAATLKRLFDDLTLEHLRLVEDYDDSSDDAVKEQIAEADEDVHIQKKRLAGSSHTWAIADMTAPANITYGSNSGTGDIAHDEYFGANTAAAGSDIYIAAYHEDTKVELERRDIDIYYEKIRLAGQTSGSTNHSMVPANRTYTFGNPAIDHNELFGTTNTARDGSDIALAVTKNAEVDAGYITTLNRTIEEATWQTTLIPGHEEKYLPAYLVCGNTDSRITNLVAYGTPTIPYILKEDSIGSILNKIYDEIPVAELRAVRSEDNGIAAMAYGVYLYFSMAGTMVERYYDQRLDDIGPNRLDGLPRNRQGVIRKMLPYPGRFYIAIDAGSTGSSSILCSNELGWHEIYRAPITGRSITDMHIQTIPGDDNSDRLWVGCESSVFKLPIAINPLSQTNYKYYGYRGIYPYIETSWIDYGMKDVNKYFHSVTLFADYPVGVVDKGREFFIKVYYRLKDNGAWIEAGLAGDNSEIPQEVVLDSTNHSTSGKKIQLKFEFQINTSASYTPRLKAWVLNGILRMPVKKSWQVTFALEPKKDLQDRVLMDDYNTLINQLNAWADSKQHNTPLIMRSCDELTDNKLVFIDPASVSLINAVLEQNRGNTLKQYDHLAQMTLYEV